MKHIYSFMLGIIIFILLAATVQQTNLLTVKPAIPKSTIVKAIRSFYIEDDIQKYTLSKIKEGYIVKTIAMSEGRSWAKAIIVMEKY